MPKEINREEMAHLMRPENKMVGRMPYQYYFGEDTYGYYLLNNKQAKVCYWFEHTFGGDIEFHSKDIVLILNNSFVSIRDHDSAFHIRFNWGWNTLSEWQWEMETIQTIIKLLDGDE